MHHYVAFLRGINLGYRRIKMDVLREKFEELKFTDVATFIASGNVLFSSKSANAQKLEQQIQSHLKTSLGYEVATFVRTRAEVAAVAAFRPFAQADLDHPGHTVYVGFLREPLSATQARGLLLCGTDVDVFCVEGREYYWLCRIKSNDSRVLVSPQMKALKLPFATMRNLTTVRKIAALYPPTAD